MEYIRAKCKTNLDDYDCSIVTQFVALPRKGERVEVSRKGSTATLVICQITHTYDIMGPMIIVELTDRFTPTN